MVLIARFSFWWNAGFERARSGLREPRELLAAHPQPHSGSVVRGPNHSHRLLWSEAVRTDAHFDHPPRAHGALLHVLQEELLPVHQSGVSLRGSWRCQVPTLFGNHRPSVHTCMSAGRSSRYSWQEIQLGYPNRFYCQCRRLNSSKLSSLFLFRSWQLEIVSGVQSSECYTGACYYWVPCHRVHGIQEKVVNRCGIIPLKKGCFLGVRRRLCGEYLCNSIILWQFMYLFIC